MVLVLSSTNAVKEAPLSALSAFSVTVPMKRPNLEKT